MSMLTVCVNANRTEKKSKPAPLTAVNGLPVRPAVSKLPTPSTVNKLRPPADSMKRRSELDLPGGLGKRPRLDLSACSDTSSDSAPPPPSQPTTKRALHTSVDRRGFAKPRPKGACDSRPSVGVKKLVRKVSPPVAMVTPARVTRPVATPRPSASGGRVAAPTAVRTAMTAAKPAPTTTVASGGRKRAAWDVKGRLLDMEAAMGVLLAEKDGLEQQSSQHTQSYLVAKSENNALTHEVERRSEHSRQQEATIEGLERRVRDGEEDLEVATKKFERELSAAAFERSQVERQRAALEAELEATLEEGRGLRTTVASLAGLSAELSATKLSLERAEDARRDKDAQITLLGETVQQRDETIAQQEAKMRQHETDRRALHNTIQQLKGNIRVFCRVRPLLKEEKCGDEVGASHMTFPDDERRTVELERLSDDSGVSARSNNVAKYEFNFDRVFRPADTQADVFDEISQLIQSALDGYNVCIFAYGQTGSGKTYTMEGGGAGSGEAGRGMIPRAVTQIFSSAASLQQKGWMYDLDVSFFEIYKETIRDLLGSGRDDTKHDIKLVSANSSEVAISNLTNVKVTGEAQVSGLLKTASENRVVAETKCNKRSSRSHSVFRMKLSGRNCLTDEKSVGVLHLVDLAGSERLKESGSQGERLKETQSINTSLANLGNVIMALANKDSHIPYRNSKLTHLLQNCLGGSSKTLMFVNVSPRDECFTETLNSLRFATKVNSCNIGTAQKRSK